MLFRVLVRWLWSVTSIGLVLFSGHPALTHANNFYGIQSLKPMVKENETTAYLPGGSRLKIQDDETKYSLTDHLGSTRLAVAGNNSVSMRADYTPFGDTLADTAETANQYTGMTYEPETATYDYHARSYDGSTARFTAVDAIRESISPYSYTANNPINFVDPDGQGKVAIWLYSIIEREDPIRFRKNFHLEQALEAKRYPLTENDSLIETAPLESDPHTITLKSGDELEHLTVSVINRYAFGGPRGITREVLTSGATHGMGPESFADYLHERLGVKVGGASRDLKSIMLDSCCLLDTAFAERFAARAKEIFPNLKKVIASRYYYDISFYGGKDTLTIKTSVGGTAIKEIGIKDYFTGNLSKDWFEAPSISNVSLTGREVMEKKSYRLRVPTLTKDGMEIKEGATRESHPFVEFIEPKFKVSNIVASLHHDDGTPRYLPFFSEIPIVRE